MEIKGIPAPSPKRGRRNTRRFDGLGNLERSQVVALTTGRSRGPGGPLRHGVGQPPGNDVVSGLVEQQRRSEKLRSKVICQILAELHRSAQTQLVRTIRHFAEHADGLSNVIAPSANQEHLIVVFELEAAPGGECLAEGVRDENSGAHVFLAGIPSCWRAGVRGYARLW